MSLMKDLEKFLVILVHALSQHLHSSACLVSHPKAHASGVNEGQLGNFTKKNKSKSKDALAYLKQANLKGPNWMCVPKSSVT